MKYEINILSTWKFIATIEYILVNALSPLVEEIRCQEVQLYDS